MVSPVLEDSFSGGSERYELEEAQCGLCGSPQSEPLFYARGGDRPGETWRLVRCTRCGLVRTDPRPADPLGMEEDIFQSYHSIATIGSGRSLKLSRWQKYFQRKLEEKLRGVLVERLRLLRRYAEAREILEIGCGDGSLLKCLADEGWSVDGVDLSQNAVLAAKRKYGLSLRSGAFEEMNCRPNGIRLVALYAVLEHIDKPVAFLKRVHRILKRNGLLVFLVPNFGSIQTRLFRQNSYLLRLPQHLYHYTPQTVKRLLEKCSFTVLRIHHNGGIESSQSFKFSAKQAVRSWLGRPADVPPCSNSEQKWGVLRTRTGVVDLFVDPLFQFLSYLEALLGCGGTITAVARKR